MITKSKPIKSKKLRNSARGQDCLAHTPVCSNDKETTVLAHLNGGGMGAKHSDLEAGIACADCHIFFDRTYEYMGYTKDQRDLWHHECNMRTRQWWVDNGYIGVV